MTTSLIMLSGAVSAIDFNTDAMDANDKQNIDLSHFTNVGYIMPGEYRLEINVNNHRIPEQVIAFMPVMMNRIAVRCAYRKRWWNSLV